MSSIAVSAAEVRGLTPYTSLAELRDLFTQAGPVLQITATSNFTKDTLSAVVFFEGADAAIQATHLFQGYSLRSSHPLLVTPATGLALQLCGIAQQWQNVSVGCACALQCGGAFMSVCGWLYTNSRSGTLRALSLLGHLTTCCGPGACCQPCILCIPLNYVS